MHYVTVLFIIPALVTAHEQCYRGNAKLYTFTYNRGEELEVHHHVSDLRTSTKLETAKPSLTCVSLATPSIVLSILRYVTLIACSSSDAYVSAGGTVQSNRWAWSRTFFVSFTLLRQS
ncbi:unnamed protein product [Heligmosomoides polygyrus]|uniref:Secreted protein n=1 Tax=Heligmosomoides polygyrus TaxID=6339 RepID=A0A183FQQ4_HELPZ|nr:unnamed protein product [Heligmosomoides polygyrus]